MTLDTLKTKVKADPTNIGWAHKVKGLTPCEYKWIALIALKAIAKNKPLMTCGIMDAQAQGLISPKMDCAKSARYWAAHTVSKDIFEGQSFFDPYQDAEFIKQAAEICPHYILRYTEK